VEIESQGLRLVLDIGTPLDVDDSAKVELPWCRGSTRKPHAPRYCPSHPHVDHYGLAFRLPKTTTFLMGEATERILAAAALFTPLAGRSILSFIWLTASRSHWAPSRSLPS